MNVYIVFGKNDSGKTTAIVNVANDIKVNNTQYNDLIGTSGGQKLNQNIKNHNEQKDIFISITKNGKRVLILSAGDVKDDVDECLNCSGLNYDVFIFAARSYTRPSVSKYLKKKFGNSCNYINVEAENLSTVSQIETELRNQLKKENII